MPQVCPGLDARYDQIDRLTEEAKGGKGNTIRRRSITCKSLRSVRQAHFPDPQGAVQGFDVPTP